MCEVVSPNFHALNGQDSTDWPQVSWDLGLETPCEPNLRLWSLFGDENMSQNMRDVVWWMCDDGPWLILPPFQNKSYILENPLNNLANAIERVLHILGHINDCHPNYLLSYSCAPPPMATLASTNDLDILMIINEEDVSVIGYYLIPHNSQVCFTKESCINNITSI
jgi:hypothetical protein